jgi:hypothetical protein
MLVLSAALGVVVVQAAAPIARPAATNDAIAFVALERVGAVAVLRGRPWRLVRRLTVPAGPHKVAASADGRFVAVSSPPAGAVTIIDVRNASPLLHAVAALLLLLVATTLAVYKPRGMTPYGRRRQRAAAAVDNQHSR